jgi:integrase
MPRPRLPIGTWGTISVREVKPNQWRARTRFRGGNGYSRQIEAWGRSRAGAERELRLRLTELSEQSGTVITSETRLEDLANYWLRTEVVDSDLAINTQQRYAKIVSAKIVPGVGGLTVREATVSRMADFIGSLAAESPTVANLSRSVLVGMFNAAVRHDARPANPMREIRAVPAAQHEVRALTAAEVHELRRTLYRDTQALRADLPPLVDVMLATGCRIGEALALRWSDVDLEAGTIAITGTIVRDNRRGLIRQDKTKGRRARAMSIPAPLVTMLLARSVDGLPGGPLDLVFPTAKLTPREVTTVNRQWREFRKRHPQWAWVSSHVFRKSVGTAIERVEGLETAAKVLGHSSPRTTDRHYVERPKLGPDVTAVLGAFVEPIEESAG